MRSLRLFPFILSAIAALLLISQSVSAQPYGGEMLCGLLPIEEELLSSEETELLREKEGFFRVNSQGQEFPACGIYSSQLSHDEQSLYSQFCLAYEQLLYSGEDIEEQRFAVISYDGDAIDRARLRKIYYVFYYTNPQYFYAYNGYSVGTDENGTAIVALKVYEQFMDGSLRSTVREEISRKAQGWLSEASRLESDLDRQRYLAYKLCENVQYVSNAPLNQSLAGALYYGECVCNGYAMAMNYLCNLGGLETFTVVSRNHAWNVTELYGTYYQTDTTWMDSAYDPALWLNKSESVFNGQDRSGSHKIDMTYFTDMTLPPLLISDTDDTVDLGAFPDGAMRSTLSELFDRDGSGGLCLNEYAPGERLDISGRGISDLSGIELIPSVRALDCSFNSIMFADLSKTALSEESFLSDMNITELVWEGEDILLPPGFDISRSSRWTGAVPEGNAVTDITGTGISYSYDCGSGIERTFYIHVKGSSRPEDMLTDNLSLAFGDDAALRLEKGESLFGILLDTGRKFRDKGEFTEWLYYALLGRFPDKEGLNSWLTALDRGYSLKYVIRGFLCSEEFHRLAEERGFSGDIFSVPPEDMRSREELITAVYKGFLGRTPQRSEVLGWKNVRDTGDIVRGVIGSEEYRLSPLSADEFVSRLYFVLLERAPDPQGFSHWQDIYVREGAYGTAGLFVSSREYRDKHITNT